MHFLHVIATECMPAHLSGNANKKRKRLARKGQNSRLVFVRNSGLIGQFSGPIHIVGADWIGGAKAGGRERMK